MPMPLRARMARRTRSPGAGVGAADATAGGAAAARAKPRLATGERRPLRSPRRTPDVRQRLILLGLLLTAFALHLMAGFTVFVPVKDIVVTGVIQGFGLGFVFIPLSTITYITLPTQYRAEAASLFSLVRNIGSSLGVSLGFTLFTRNTVRQHAYMTEAITPYSTWLDLNTAPGNIALGSDQVLSLVDLELTRQAMAIAYINDFKLMMFLVLFLVPMVLFLDNTKPATA